MNIAPLRASAWSDKNLRAGLPNALLRMWPYIELSVTGLERLYVAIHQACANIAALLRRSYKYRFA
jgi:hypothetical protein